MLKILLFLRELNWLTISSLLSAFLSVVVAFIPGSPLVAPIALTGLAVSLALLALRD
jgi:hypothetical protein